MQQRRSIFINTDHSVMKITKEFPSIRQDYLVKFTLTQDFIGQRETDRPSTLETQHYMTKTGFTMLIFSVASWVMIISR